MTLNSDVKQFFYLVIWCSGKESTCSAGGTRDAASIPVSGRSPGGGHGNPLQCPCFGKPKDRGAWWATVNGAAKKERKKESEITQSCLTLCNPVDCSIPGSSIHGILQARVLEWGAIGFSGVVVEFSSVAQSCPTLCNPMNRSMLGLPVHLQLPEFTQAHVHRVSDAIQPSHPLSSPSPPAPNPSQRQSLFQ